MVVVVGALAVVVVATWSVAWLPAQPASSVAAASATTASSLGRRRCAIGCRPTQNAPGSTLENASNEA